MDQRNNEQLKSETINKLKKEVEELFNENHKYVIQIKLLEEQIKDFKNQIKDFKNQIKDFKNQINDFGNQNEDLREQNKELKEKTEGQDVIITILKVGNLANTVKTFILDKILETPIDFKTTSLKELDKMVTEDSERLTINEKKNWAEFKKKLERGNIEIQDLETLQPAINLRNAVAHPTSDLENLQLVKKTKTDE